MGKSASFGPKLLIVVAEDWYFVSHRLELAQAAHRAGFNVSVATRVGRHGEIIRKAGIGLHAVPFDRSGISPATEVATIACLYDLYRRERPDIVHHVAIKPVLYGSLAARTARVGAIVNALGGLGYVFRSDSARARLVRVALTPLLRAALNASNMRLIIQNSDDSQVVVKRRLVQPDRVRLIRGAGVDPARYRQVVADTNPPLIILPARLLYDKGVCEFVSAAMILRQRGISARFALVGDRDPKNPACVKEEIVEYWRTEGIVELWGWRDDMPDVLASAQIVCLPSYHEGLPKALLEAAASGAAIVASDIPGCREIVRRGETGWLVPVRDSVALADSLQIAIENPKLRAKYGTAARNLIERELSVERVAADTIAVYRELLGEHQLTASAIASL